MIEVDGSALIVNQLAFVFTSEVAALRVIVGQEVRERLHNPIGKDLVAFARKVELFVVEVCVDNASIVFALEEIRWKVRC